jgi:hypothetical protein
VTTPAVIPARADGRFWRIIPLCSLGFFILTCAVRIHRIEIVSGVASGPAADAASMPRLLIPGHSNESFEWLDQTREMFARGELRVRRVDYENAPYGREVHSASPYRWWLGLIAWCHHEITGRPMARSVGWAALVADPLLLVLLGTTAVLFVSRRFGAFAAAILSAGLVTLFPFGSEFLPGTPDDRGLAMACAVWSVLPILAGADPQAGDRRSRRLFLAAGAAGGAGLWVDPPGEAVILLGIATGAVLAAWTKRPTAGGSPGGRGPLPLREWALGGAVVSFAGYVAEYFPHHMGSWELRAVHPLFSLAWLGGGELLVWLTRSRTSGHTPRTGRLLAIGGAVAVASVPVLLWRTHSTGFLAVDLPSMTLSKLPGGVSARNFSALLLQNGIGPTLWAAVLPGVLVPLAAILLAMGRFGPGKRATLAVALGPALVAFAFACWQICFWNVVDVALLGLFVTLAAGCGSGRRPAPWMVALLAAVSMVPGALRQWPWRELGSDAGFTETEVVSLVERDLALWMAKHVGSGDAVMLAPPDATTALYYYGGLRGMGTFDWENQDGIRGAVRIVSASTPEEAQELINQRGVTHLIIPSWDPYLDAYARMGQGELEGTFLERLHRWALPPWLRPVSYLMPTIAGFEGQSVIILEVVDPQNDAVAASRLAEYFVDTGQLDLAAGAGPGLKRFLGDPGATVVRAEVAIALNQSDEFAGAVEVLLRRIAGGADRSLAWDQRVRLAIVLARAGHLDLARVQVSKCLEQVDDDKLRSLSTKALFRFHVLLKGFALQIADPGLRAVSMDLLPSDLRGRLEK